MPVAVQVTNASEWVPVNVDGQLLDLYKLEQCSMNEVGNMLNVIKHLQTWVNSSQTTDYHTTVKIYFHFASMYATGKV